MMKYITILALFVALVSCNFDDETYLFTKGTISHITSCNGGLEPVYVIKLSVENSILVANLPDAFQIPDKEILFETKAPLSII